MSRCNWCLSGLAVLLFILGLCCLAIVLPAAPPNLSPDWRHLRFAVRQEFCRAYGLPHTYPEPRTENGKLVMPPY